MNRNHKTNGHNGHLQPGSDREARILDGDALYQANLLSLLDTESRGELAGSMPAHMKWLRLAALRRYNQSLAGRNDELARHGLNFNSVGERMQ